MTVAQAFERVAFLRALTPAERERLLPYGQVKVLSRGDGCWAEGQPADEFVFVLHGRMKLVKATENGRDTILEMGSHGELLCGNAVFCYAPYCCSSVAMDDATGVLILPRRDVLEVVERHPLAARALVRELTERGINMCRRLEELAGGPVERRLALLLLKLADRAGVARAGDGIRIPIRLSRQDLADLCGTTLETTIRIMSRLKKGGVVHTTARGFHIANRQALEGVANGRGDE